MPTQTDKQWTERLENVMPANFMDNIGTTQFVENIYGTLLRRIGLTMVHNPDNFGNYFSEYVSTIMDYGDQIQEIKVKVATAKEHQPTLAITDDTWNTDPYKIVKNPPIVQYEKLNDGVTYQATLFDDQLKLAFNTPQRFGDLMAGLTDAMYEADNLDKYIKFKKYMSNPNNFKVKEAIATGSDDKTFYENMLKTFMKYPRLMKLPSKDYNVNEDMAKSEQIDIIMRTEDRVRMDADILAGVYNLNKVEIDAKIKTIDDFGTVQINGEDKKIAALIIDRRFIKYNPRTPIASGIYQPNGAYTNLFLHVQGIYSVAKFRNAIMLLDERP